MSYLLRLAELPVHRVALAYSVGYETMLSLHVLTDSKHHALHIPWVLRARKAVPQALKEEMDALCFLYRRPLASFWPLTMTMTNTSTQAAEPPSFQQDIASLLAAPVAFYADEAVRVVLGKPVTLEEVRENQALVEELLQKAVGKHPRAREAVQELVEDQEGSRQRFVQMMTAYWETFFAGEWLEIEARLQEDVKARRQLLEQKGVLNLLQHLSPEISVNRTETTALIRRPSKAEIHFAKEDVLFLAPSYFAWPHLLVKTEKPVILNYAVSDVQQEAKTQPLSDQLLQRLKTLADVTRLQIIQLLAQQPRSTRELAGLIGLTEAAISKHLKQLQEAELVVARRDSYFVFYQLVDDPFAEVVQGLQNILHMPKVT